MKERHTDNQWIFKEGNTLGGRVLLSIILSLFTFAFLRENYIGDENSREIIMFILFFLIFFTFLSTRLINLYILDRRERLLIFKRIGLLRAKEQLIPFDQIKAVEVVPVKNCDPDDKRSYDWGIGFVLSSGDQLVLSEISPDIERQKEITQRIRAYMSL
jgi:hypothetical protein